MRRCGEQGEKGNPQKHPLSAVSVRYSGADRWIRSAGIRSWTSSSSRMGSRSQWHSEASASPAARSMVIGSRCSNIIYTDTHQHTPRSTEICGIKIVKWKEKTEKSWAGGSHRKLLENRGWGPADFSSTLLHRDTFFPLPSLNWGRWLGGQGRWPVAGGGWVQEEPDGHCHNDAHSCALGWSSQLLFPAFAN